MGSACSRRALPVRVVRQLTELQSAVAVVNWTRFVTAFIGVRRLQRLFAYIGHHLQTIKAPLRHRLVRFYPLVR